MIYTDRSSDTFANYNTDLLMVSYIVADILIYILIYWLAQGGKQ